MLDFRAYCPMDKRALTQEQLQEHLRRQLNHLRVSAEQVDQGNLDEAVRLGTTVRVLCHDTPKSHSLLGQLGLKAGEFVDSCIYRDQVDVAHAAYLAEHYPDDDLVVVAVNASEVGFVTMAEAQGIPTYVPVLGTRGARLSDFNTWWTKPAIETLGGTTFDRKTLVSVMANKDGGAHVDPDGDATYEDFVQENLGISYADGDYADGGEPPGGWLHPRGNVAAASMRQIAWELEQTIAKLQLPYL